MHPSESFCEIARGAKLSATTPLKHSRNGIDALFLPAVMGATKSQICINHAHSQIEGKRIFSIHGNNCVLSMLSNAQGGHTLANLFPIILLGQ